MDQPANTTSSGSILNQYDFENRMTLHGNVQLQYDGDGNRVKEIAGGVTTAFLVDDHNPTGLPQVQDEIVSGSVTRTYAYGLNRISENQQIGGNWTPTFYGQDGHGSVRFLMNSSGAITDTYQYDAFGNQIASTGTTLNIFLFSGEQYDSSVGSFYLRARYYRPPTGRFWTGDPYEGTILDPASLHRYIYTRGDPVNRVDPTGRADLFEVEVRAGLTIKEVAIALRFGARIACLFYDVYFSVDTIIGGDPNKKPLVCNLLNLKWPQY